MKRALGFIGAVAIAASASVVFAGGQGAAEKRPSPAPEPTPFVQREDVSVGRVLVNTHVLRKDGTAIANLSLSDFQVEIDGNVATVESAEWVDQETPTPPETGERNAEITVGSRATDTGRLIVLLFQWEVASQKQIGFVRMQRQAVSLVRSLHPADRVAVLLFDSRLWLIQDFTSDGEVLAAAVESVLSRKTRRGDGSGLSLADGLSNGGKEATGIEKALLAIANALKPIPGPKSLVFFGWGIGEWQPTFQNQRTGYVRNRPEYAPARRALNASETAVFCLDVSEAAHNLWEGLDRTAFDTGGFYMPTELFPEFAIDRLRKALHGYYALVIVKPQGIRGRHEIKVRVRKAVPTWLVLHRSGYHDDEDSPGHE